MAAPEKNLAIQRFGPPPQNNAAQYAEKLRDSALAASDYIATLQARVDAKLHIKNSTIEEIGAEHLGVLLFLNELYLNDHIELLTKLGEQHFVKEVATYIDGWVNKPVTITLKNLPASLHKTPGITIHNDMAELTMTTLARANRTKALKLNKPEHFAFLAEFFIAEHLSDQKNNSNFINTLMTAIVMDQKDLTLIRTKLNRENAYRSPEVINALLSTVELLQKFSDVFLVALINLDHPNHEEVLKLLKVLMLDESQNPDLDDDLPSIVCSALAQALMTRTRTAEGQKKLGYLPGDWLIRLEELDETTPDTPISFSSVSEAIAREVENDLSRQHTFIVTGRSFLESLPKYTRLLRAYIAENRINNASGQQSGISSMELEKTGEAIKGILYEVIAPFSRIQPAELSLPLLRAKFSSLKFGASSSFRLEVDSQTLSEPLRNAFPHLQGAEVSFHSNDADSAQVHFIVRSNHQINGEKIADYFSFTLVLSSTEGILLPDLLEMKQHDETTLRDDPAVQTINQVITHLGLQLLKNLNIQLAPKEKTLPPRISTPIVMGLTGTSPTALPGRRNVKAAQTTSSSQSKTSPENPIKPVKIKLIADNLTNFDLTRFGVPAAEAMRKIQQAVELWNERGNLTQSRLRTQPNLYRLSCTVGTTPIRVFFEIRPDSTAPTKQRLTITDIRKRNEKTYKGL